MVFELEFEIWNELGRGELIAVEGEEAGCVPGSGRTRSGIVAAAAADAADLEIGGSCRIARGMGSLPSSMLPS